MNKISLKKISNNVLNIQIDSIHKFKSFFNKNFEEIIDFLVNIKVRIIIIESDILASKALKTMNDNKITQPIVVENGIYLGMTHMHQILSSGIR